MARRAPSRAVSRDRGDGGDRVGRVLDGPSRSAPGLDTGEHAVRPSVVAKPTIRGRRVVQGRRVRRVIRRIDAWTVFKLSLLFYMCVCLVLLIAGVILWNIASTFNVITNVEKFIKSLADLQTFKLHPGVILEAGALGGVILVILGTGVNVLVALLYNLISDVIGGVQVIVLEEQDET
jgi:hypothetical protein